MAWPDDSDDDVTPKIEDALVLQEPDTFAKIWDDSVSLVLPSQLRIAKGIQDIWELKKMVAGDIPCLIA